MSYVCYVGPLNQPADMTMKERFSFVVPHPEEKESGCQGRSFTEPFIDVSGVSN